jgi:hypothetical protein
MSRPSTVETLYEFPRPKSGGGAHSYQLLQQDAGWTAFLAESATSVVDMEWQTVNPNLMPIEEFRKFSPFRQFHDDTLQRYLQNLPPSKGRVSDVFLSAAKRADDNQGSWTLYFTKETTTKPITVGGTVFVDGVPTYAEITIGANVEVLKRHDKQPKGPHYAMDVTALMFQTQCPEQQHVPILDEVTEDGSRAHLSSTGSSSSRWPSISNFGGKKRACTNQLIGLLQFSVIPRHPQLQSLKYCNWGYDRRGISRTLTYRQQRDPAARIVISETEEESEDEESDDDDHEYRDGLGGGFKRTRFDADA